MSEHIKQYVKQLFAEALSKSSTICENPVTGEHFVPGLDRAGPHKARAVQALEAQARYKANRSNGLPDMPLNARQHSGSFKWQSVGHYLVGAFTESLRRRDFRLEGHPDFETFARGVMASPLTPARVRNDPDLLRCYPPKALVGLGMGFVYEA